MLGKIVNDLCVRDPKKSQRSQSRNKSRKPSPYRPLD